VLASERRKGVEVQGLGAHSRRRPAARTQGMRGCQDADPIQRPRCQPEPPARSEPARAADHDPDPAKRRDVLERGL